MLNVNSLLGFQQKTPQRSTIRLHTSASASGGTSYARTWTEVVAQYGNDIAYQRDAVNGDRFVAVSDGMYIICYSDSCGTLDRWHGLSLNADPTTPITNYTTNLPLLAIAIEAHASAPSTCVYAGFLKAGDVVRCVTNDTGIGTNPIAHMFVMMKISGT